MQSDEVFRWSRRTALGAAGAAVLGALTGCSTSATPPPPAPAAPSSSVTPPPPRIDMAAPAAAVLPRATVPVLCWHQLRDWRPDDSDYSRRSLICPPAKFTAQLDGIRAAGFTAIGPDDYLAHLTTGAALPPRPVLLTFDDSQGSQISVGLPELHRRKMTATFFVMTVPLDKPNWMRRDDVRRLHGEGMTIGAHTYDHHRVDRYSGDDWTTQLDRPRRELEALVEAPVQHFAYPFGAWNAAAFPHLGQAGYRTAFQLGDKPVDRTRPLLSLRRILVTSTWTGAEIAAELRRPV